MHIGDHHSRADRGGRPADRPARPAPGRRGARSRAGSPTATTASTSAATTTWSGCRASAPRCSASTARPSARPTTPPRSWASRPQVAAMLENPPCLVTAFVKGRELTAEELRKPDASRRWPTPCALPRLGHGAAHQLRLVPARRRLRGQGARARRRAAGGVRAGARSGPRHRGRPAGTGRARARALPQRPAHRELPARRRARADHRLGVRRHRRPLLRPGQLRGEQRARRRRRGAPARGLLRRAGGRQAAGSAQALPLHVGLPRGHVGRGPDERLGARSSTSAATRTSTSSAWPGPGRTTASTAGCGRRADSGPRAPRLRPLRDRRRGRRRDVDRLSPGRARLRGRAAGGPQPAHVGLDLPLGRSVRPAARLGVADPDDDALGRAVPEARGGLRLGRVRRPAAGLERGAAWRSCAARPRGPTRSGSRWSW